MEFDLNEDPATYEARPIFGKFSARSAVVGLAAGALGLAVAGGLYLVGAPAQAVAGGCVLVCVPLGYLGLSKSHGLRAEEWVPLELADRRSVQELIWSAPRPVLDDGDEGEPTREERKRERHRERRAARESEQEDLLGSEIERLRAGGDVTGEGE